MNLNLATVEPSSVIWILVANEEQAHIYRYLRNKEILPTLESPLHPDDSLPTTHHLIPVPDMAFKAESLADFEARRDERGSLIAQQDAGQTPYEPYADIYDEITQNLVAKVASRITHYCKTKAFDHLGIAAPPKILGGLKQQLDPLALQCVIAEIDKDFTKVKRHEILAYLQEMFVGTALE